MGEEETNIVTNATPMRYIAIAKVDILPSWIRRPLEVRTPFPAVNGTTNREYKTSWYSFISENINKSIKTVIISLILKYVY
jgi:hypothetical protein